MIRQNQGAKSHKGVWLGASGHDCSLSPGQPLPATRLCHACSWALVRYAAMQPATPIEALVAAAPRSTSQTGLLTFIIPDTIQGIGINYNATVHSIRRLGWPRAAQRQAH